MKKLVVSKILLLVSLPMWVACGGSVNPSEISTTKSNNEINFLAKKAKAPEGVRGLVRLKDGEDISEVSNDIASDEGVRGIVASEKAAAQEEIEAGKRAVNSVPVAPELDEGVRGIVVSENAAAQEEIEAGKRAVNSAELDEGVRGFIELDEGVRGLMEKISALDEGVRGKSVQLDDESLARLIKLDEGVRGLMAVVAELDEGVRGKKLSLADEGVRGKMAELQKIAQEYSNILAEIESAAGLDEGVRGKFLLEKNILSLEGEVSDKEIDVLYLVVNGQEKYEIKVNPETRTYGAQFELDEKDMKEMVMEFVFGKDVMTLLVQDGELKVYNK